MIIIKDKEHTLPYLVDYETFLVVFSLSNSSYQGNQGSQGRDAGYGGKGGSGGGSSRFSDGNMNQRYSSNSGRTSSNDNRRGGQDNSSRRQQQDSWGSSSSSRGQDINRSSGHGNDRSQGGYSDRRDDRGSSGGGRSRRSGGGGGGQDKGDQQSQKHQVELLSQAQQLQMQTQLQLKETQMRMQLLEEAQRKKVGTVMFVNKSEMENNMAMIHVRPCNFLLISLNESHFEGTAKVNVTYAPLPIQLFPGNWLGITTLKSQDPKHQRRYLESMRMNYNICIICVLSNN